MNLWYTILCALFGLACIVTCDFLLQKRITKSLPRMVISYTVGLAMFLICVRLFAVLLT